MNAAKMKTLRRMRKNIIEMSVLVRNWR